MSIEVVPFTDGHVDQALELLAGRHRRMRDIEPLLTDRYERQDAWTERLAGVRSNAAAPGLAALHDDRLVGHLFWEFHDPQPGTYLEPFTSSGSVDARVTGYIVDPAFAHATRRLYLAAAKEWVLAGRGAHGIPAVHADREGEGALVELGFGRFLSLAIAPTCPTEPDAPADGLQFRPAEAGDEEIVYDLASELWRSFSDSPMFLPHIPGVNTDLHAYVDRALRDPATPIWLAGRGGRIQAMQLFLTPESESWFLGPPLDRQGTIYLFWAATDPASRGQGVQSQLLRHTMNWARQRGFESIALHYLSASLASVFWQRHGFRPVVHWMSRRIDPRALLVSPR
ncbi:MAG: N-acetyltransferase family protein [Planctomycetaceae bacterium]